MPTHRLYFPRFSSNKFPLQQPGDPYQTDYLIHTRLILVKVFGKRTITTMTHKREYRSRLWSLDFIAIIDTTINVQMNSFFFDNSFIHDQNPKDFYVWCFDAQNQAFSLGILVSFLISLVVLFLCVERPNEEDQRSMRQNRSKHYIGGLRYLFS